MQLLDTSLMGSQLQVIVDSILLADPDEPSYPSTSQCLHLLHEQGLRFTPSQVEGKLQNLRGSV